VLVLPCQQKRGIQPLSFVTPLPLFFEEFGAPPTFHNEVAPPSYPSFYRHQQQLLWLCRSLWSCYKVEQGPRLGTAGKWDHPLGSDG